MNINIKRTKVMTTEEWKSFEVDGVEIEMVTSFCFLGALVENKGGCDKEIRRRLTLGRVPTQATCMEKIWKNKNVSKLTKPRIILGNGLPSGFGRLRNMGQDKGNGNED